MTVKEKRLIAKYALKWCEKKFGTPLKKSFPELIIKGDKRVTSKYGEYVDRKIYIFLNVCNTKSAIIRTVIHEYTHFLQMPKINDTIKYFKLSQKFKYDNHPYEVEALTAEKKYFSSCYKSLQKNGIF
jgi:Zn-dependent peptidase ImmA (M78 family)